MIQYDKILVYQYGKVGSTSIRKSGLCNKYYSTIQKTYKEQMISTHSHEVAKDILSKYKNVLVINIVRLPIDRNISGFFQNINKYTSDYNELHIDDLIKMYDELYNPNTDNWMVNFFKGFNIDIDKFKFDKINKYNKLTYNSNDILLFRFEDLEYITSNILPKYNIFVNNKKNVGSSKSYNEVYENFKKIYKISDLEKERILNSKITNIYYSKEEIQEQIKKYS